VLGEVGRRHDESMSIPSMVLQPVLHNELEVENKESRPQPNSMIRVNLVMQARFDSLIPAQHFHPGSGELMVVPKQVTQQSQQAQQLHSRFRPIYRHVPHLVTEAMGVTSG
jgi:hypothetical protein